jgi:hypothetical protein
VALAFLILCWSPTWIKHVSPIVKSLFFTVDKMHPELERGRGIDILDLADINFIMTSNSLLNTPESEDIIAATNKQYQLQKKGLIDSLRETQRGTAVVIQWMEAISDFFEKLRNLVQW